ncbi:MAG TPA: M64 family metallopeptidase [Flavobacterium sp.]|nr:M64 family metallopeptidase [Flavobacterium sp.]
MKKIYYLLFILLAGTTFSNAQVFDVETIVNNGDPDKLINLVIMGDGYTAAQQGAFVSKAQSLSTYIFNQSPWKEYKNYFNVYAIKVISNESGAKHPNNASDCSLTPLPVSNPDNYLGSSFDNYDIHRLIIANSASQVANVLAANVPNYDLAIIIANTTAYGGSGGDYATITAHSSANEIFAHEAGHSFAGLADEYYAGDVYFHETTNMTQQSNPALVKWKNWISTPTPNIGVYNYCCGGNSNLWYRPAVDNQCKMDVLNVAYCPVCQEGIVEKIHTLVDPILEYTPASLSVSATNQFLDFNLTQLAKPVPNTLAIKWVLDGNVNPTNLETFQVNQAPLSVGIHTLSAIVTDESPLVRTDNHALVHVHTVTWSIDRTALGVNVNGLQTEIAYGIYPNPANDIVNVAVELDKNSTLQIQLVSMDGKIIREFPSKKIEKGKYTDSISISNLASGSYLVVFKIDGVRFTKTLVKQ